MEAVDSQGLVLPALGRALGLRRSDLPGTATYHAVLVLPADDEAGRELSSRLEDVVHSRHNGAGAQALILTAGPTRRFRQFPHELSGGLRQRVMITMAVARRPTLVIADEPTTALDVLVQADIVRLFRGLRDDLRVAFVFITHDLALAAQICDRIVVLYGGRIGEAAPAAVVLDRPRHPYTAALLRTRLTLEADTSAPLQTLPGEPPDPRNYSDECPFVPRCRFADDQRREALPVLAPIANPPHQASCWGHDGNGFRP